MKKLLTVPLLFCIAILVLFVWWKTMSSPVNTRNTAPRDFIVTRGQTLTSISKNLEKQGFIKSNLVFRLYTSISLRPKVVQAGDYRLSPSLSLHQIILTFEKGPEQFWVTFPEGLRREEMIDKVVSALELSTEEAKKFAQEFMTASQGQEGMLFPDTYLLGKDDGADKLVTKMKGIFNTKVTPQMISDAKKNKLDLSEIVILASIIERETKTDEERPVVAGILLNRIKNGMLLQVDATVQYFLGSKRCREGLTIKLNCEWWKAPTSQDLQTPSVFNTYLNSGLPTSSISNPGLSSIKAAVYPQTSDYFFYLHDSNGKIHYAKTGSEHQENVEKYLK